MNTQTIDWTAVVHTILILLVTIGNLAQYLLSRQAKARQNRLEAKLDTTYHVLTNGANLNDDLQRRAIESQDRYSSDPR
jgi:hypothetical protein